MYVPRDSEERYNRVMQRRIVIIFSCAFLLNFVWEYLHSALYVSYQGEAITGIILFRAALFDAVLITIFSYFFLSLFPTGRKKEGAVIFVFVLFAFAVLLEKWALGNGRWVYADTMPIIPLLKVGLTPAIQLGLLGYISFFITDRFS